MNDQLELPPRRALPPQTRERIRRRVMAAGAAEPHSGGRRHPGRPLWVAAAVLLLAAGAVVGGQALRDPGGGVAPGTGTAEAPESESELTAGPVLQADVDRCWAAMSSRGVSDKDREQSNARFAVPLAGRKLIVFDSGGEPAVPQFCELTRTTAVLSDPAAPPRELARTDDGSLLASTFSSPSATIAGTAPPRLDRLRATYRSPDGRHSVPAATLVDDGLFVIQPIGIPGPELRLALELIDVAGTAVRSIELGDRGGTDEPSGRVVDQWSSGDPDPTAPVNQLARCVDRSLINGIGVPAPDSWRPGARTPWHGQGGGVLVAYDGDGQVRICLVNEAGMGVALNPSIEGFDGRYQTLPFTVAHQHETVNGVVTVAGTVTPAVARVELVGRDSTVAVADLANSTYAGQLSEAVSVRLFDATGAVLYDGPILP
jgi:hypothetical protein